MRLADLDGSGTADLIYLGQDGVRVYWNESGNALSEPVTLDLPLPQWRWRVNVVDLLGTGTACLVWSSALPFEARRPVRYVDLMGGKKPHLLDRVRQRPGRRDAPRLRVVDVVLPAGQGRGAALDHAPSLPGARRRARRALRPRRRDEARHALPLPPRLLRPPWSASTGASPTSSSGTRRPSAAGSARGCSPTCLGRSTASCGSRPCARGRGSTPARGCRARAAGARARARATTRAIPRRRALVQPRLPPGLSDRRGARGGARAPRAASCGRRSTRRTGARERDHPYAVTESTYDVRLLQREGPRARGEGHAHAVFFAHRARDAGAPVRAPAARSAHRSTRSCSRSTTSATSSGPPPSPTRAAQAASSRAGAPLGDARGGRVREPRPARRAVPRRRPGQLHDERAHGAAAQRPLHARRRCARSSPRRSRSPSRRRPAARSSGARSRVRARCTTATT